MALTDDDIKHANIHAAAFAKNELGAALEIAAAAGDDRTIDQLFVVSRIVVRKYRLIRWALFLLGTGIALGIAAPLGSFLWS